MRGLLLMALSNKFGPLVLTTGNKSELAVGYCTLYGDMCGALAVIADVLKTEIYALAHWINRKDEIIPKNTIEKPPSAELRPNQTDQDSLPPYDLLDRILHHYVVADADPKALVSDELPLETVHDVLNKNRLQRVQTPPGRARLESFAPRLRHGPPRPHRARFSGFEQQSCAGQVRSK